ncbi:UNVERIFIED_CONTAM: hypothetical protein Sradi_2089700 [Sesamum radiatum]|uniref:DDE Tnp4 domain-containing protein n=1 Tax=Sesamum radiatum TaxID=300843 RepID=A0AAW2TII6_SESRA
MASIVYMDSYFEHILYRMNTSQRIKIFLGMQLIVVELVLALRLFLTIHHQRQPRHRHCITPGTRRYKMYHRIPEQVKHLIQITDISDVKCIDNLRMSRNAFARLCQLLSIGGGLQSTRHVSVAEQVAMFLSIIAHHKKNCGCLGALDGTHVEVRVPNSDKGRYRNRKGQVSTNVLGVCNTKGKFIYVLSGWEGSVADGRVLQDAATTTYVTMDTMNLFDEDGSSKPRGCRAKADKGNTRKTWTQREEEVLVNALRNIVTMGWKCENGFHAGCMITVDSQEVWDEYCKIDSSTRTMRYKAWLFFPAWREIFGKDRAVGEVTVEAHPTVNDTNTEPETETQEYYIPTAE